MGVSYGETLRESREECGITRGGVRFRREKRHRKGEGPAAIETQDRKGRPHGTKRSQSDDEDN